MGSTVISIPEEELAPQKKMSKSQFSENSNCNSLLDKKKLIRSIKSFLEHKKLIHSIKVGIALVSVSLLYLLNPLYEHFGDNAMWAIMTVVVIFEFYAGATLGKGLNRGLGTILGGGLGCLAALLAQEVGGIGNAIIVASSIFIFGAVATYARLIPSIKKRYDYGAMIFILTFSLVVVSGIRAETVLIIARDRLLTILMGFMICIFTSLVIFPVWASDELHNSTASKFEDLACSIEGFFEAYLTSDSEEEIKPREIFSSCKSVLYSKSKEESLANFARCEPWHGKFGFSYPWKQYLQIGDALRELATTILSMKSCLQSPTQPSCSTKDCLKGKCEAIGSTLARTIRDLGQSITDMRRCQKEALITPNLKSIRQEISVLKSSSNTVIEDISEIIAVSSFIFFLTDIVDKVEELAKEVEELGELAAF